MVATERLLPVYSHTSPHTAHHCSLTAHSTLRKPKRPVVPQSHGAAFSAVEDSAFRSPRRGQHSVTHTLNTFKNITINDSRKLQMWSLLPQLHPLHLQNMESSPKSPLTVLSYPFASDSQPLASKRHPVCPMISCQQGGMGGEGTWLL